MAGRPNTDSILSMHSAYSLETSDESSCSASSLGAEALSLSDDHPCMSHHQELMMLV